MDDDAFRVSVPSGISKCSTVDFPPILSASSNTSQEQGEQKLPT